MKVFRETQKISQWYIWLVPICVFILWLTGFILQVVINKPIGSKPPSNIELTLIGFIPILIILLLLQIKLTTTINEKYLKVSLYPFCSQQVSLEDISKIEIIKYEILGFGCRLGTKYGTVYNIKGNKGIYVSTKLGERFLVGSQKINNLKDHLSYQSIKYDDQIK